MASRAGFINRSGVSVLGGVRGDYGSYVSVVLVITHSITALIYYWNLAF